MRIEFKITAPEKGAFEKQVRKALRKEVVKYLEDRLRDIECSEHQERPTVSVTGSLKNPEFRIEGCCQAVIDEATEALR